MGMPIDGKSQMSAAVRRTTGGSEALERLRRGEITLDDYLDFRADESVKTLKGVVSDAKLRILRDTNRELIETDPVLVAMIRRITGLDPQGGTAT